MATDPTPKQRAAMTVYVDLLEEVKGRLQCIELILAGKIKLPDPILRELCFLQFRMLCEGIALGCLAVHGDVGALTIAPKLQKEWRADQIMERLSELDPNFYPQPIQLHEQSPHRMEMELIQDDSMSKTDLAALYGKCGDALHRGTVKNLLANKQPCLADHPELPQSLRKLFNLMKCHRIALLNGRVQVICVLSSIKHENRAHVALATAIV